MEVSPQPDWKQDLLEKFEARDGREKSFANLIESHNHLIQRFNTLIQTSKHHIATNEHLREENSNLVRQMAVLRESGSPASTAKTLELEQTIIQLKDEQSGLYKIQGQNAQRLLEMNDLVRRLEDTDKERVEEIRKFQDENKSLKSKVSLQIEQLREKDVAIQILQDELSTLHLELGQNESKLKQLMKENDELLQRWLKKMNEEAEKMNEATEFLESINARKTENYSSSKDSRRLSINQSKTTSVITGNGDINSERQRRDSSPIQTTMIPTPLPKRFTAMEGEIHAIQCSSTGNWFATGGSDKKIRVIDTHSLSVKQTLTGALGTIMGIDFSSTGEAILGCGTDHAARVWYLETGRMRHTLTGHIGKVCTGKFTGDGKKAITGSNDRTIKVWDLQKGYCVRTIFTFSICNDLCLVDEDGSTIVSGHHDNKLRLWDARTGNSIKEFAGLHTGQITSVSVSPDGSQILTNSRDHTLQLVDLRTYETINTFRDENYKNGLNWSRACFSPDGRFVVAGSIDGGLFFWNKITGAVDASLKEHSSPVCGVSWSSSGSYVVSAERDRTVCIWNASGRKDSR